MGFQETINQILEPISVDGKTYYPDIFYDGGVRQDFDAPRPGRIHNGVDFNYRDEIGNRAPLINDLHPDVNSPVSGIVTDVNEKWGIIEITDAYGNKHRICHLFNWDRTWKDKLNNKEVIEITAGQTIGQMGGRGDINGDGIYGEEEYRPHVDYKIIGKDGRYRDPEDYWNYSWESFMLKYYEGLIQKYGFFTYAAATIPQKFDPLIVDLDGDGIETLASTDGAYFDHDRNGFAERTGWVSADDGILVMDRDGDGRIGSGQELFGDQTIMSSGERAAGAFQALADLDGNSDGKIDANDTAFSQIKVWQDLDGDGYSTSDELKTLSELGISAINTSYAELNTSDGQENTQIQAGTFDKADNTTGQAGGFLLQRDTAYTIAEEWLDVPSDIAILPDLQGYGNVYDLHQAMVRDTGLELKTLVESFTATTDIMERNDLMELILFKWTGTENVIPSSHGPNIDARKLETLEKLFGQTFIGVDGSGNPNGSAAALLNQSYQGMFEMYYSQLMAQTHLQNLYGAITYSWDETTESVKGDLIPALSEIQNAAALDRDASRLVVLEFMRTIKGVQAQEMLNIGAFKDAVSVWDQEFGYLVDSVNGNLVYGNSVEDTLFGSNDSDTIVGFQGADLILGYAGNDVLMGGLGDDALLGGDGKDLLIGSDGNDSLYGENDNDFIDGGAGDDYLEGGSGDDVFTYGRGSGNDIIQRYSPWSGNSNGVDTVQFGEGLTADSFDYYGRGLNEGGDLIMKIKDTGETLAIKNWFVEDQYRVDRFLFSGGLELTAEEIDARAEILPIIGTEGDDILNGVAVPDHNNTLYGLGGNDNLLGGNRDDILDGGSGDDTLSGWDGNDTLFGGDGNDYLYGYDGNDFLDGGLGNDYMGGCSGDDNYIVDSTADIIAEAINEGIDTVQSSITYTLGNNLENLSLTGSAAINGTGNALDNIITGNIANNILNGGSGKDTMVGGLGNDTYVINSADDVVMENFGEGTDIVQSSVSYSLGVNIENLTLTGSSGINGTGNELNNILTGNSAANSLTGGAGNDTIDGKAGADIMSGGIGNDTYTVDNAGDIVIEFIDEGVDTVKSSVTYTLAANIENLTLTGSSAIKGTGNSLNNIITGNSAANILTGGDGNDTLNGGAGADTLIGGTGNDIYTVDNTGDIITEFYDQGIDIVNSSLTYTLGANLDNLTLTGSSAINGTGNELDNILTGNSAANSLAGGAGNDTIDGKAGADIMSGGIGNDTYTVDNAGDIVTEFIDEGVDTVKSSVTYTLAANIENLTLTGSNAIKGNGNSLNNIITGNSAANILIGGDGDDTLNGGAGADTLSGGTGNDIYIIDNKGDIITEYAEEGIDTVQSSITYTLNANTENLTLTGSSNINAIGNALDNIISGNSGINTITGYDGNDLLKGCAGNDILTGGNGSDIYLYSRTDGKDAINETAGLNGDTDIVKMTDGITKTEPVIVKHNNDLYLFIDSSNYVRVTNQFYQSNYGAERLEVTDGCYITRQDIDNITSAMISINSNPGMDVIQKFNAMRNDQIYINLLAQSWHQPQV